MAWIHQDTRREAKAFQPRIILSSVFATLMILILIGGVLSLVNRVVTVIPAYVSVSVDVATLSSEEKQNLRSLLKDVGLPDVSIDKIMTTEQGAMLFVTKSDGTRFTDDQFAEFRKDHKIKPADDTVKGMLVFLKHLQLEGVRFEDATVRVDRLSGGQSSAEGGR